MLTHDRWQRIKEIVVTAQSLPPEERLSFLEEIGRDDKSIREEVETLLTAEADSEDFLTIPAFEFVEGMLAREDNEFSAGETIGRYTILCSLGSGGMGQIYLARDSQLGRKIALKLISGEYAADPGRVQRLEQEARAASALNHPNVCVIYEIGITETGRHFIAMEYIQGVTLRHQLSRGSVTPLEALNIAGQVAAALASAHAEGIIHRDIKPENIMLRPDGYVKVLDFGLAKITEILTDRQSLERVTADHRERHALMGTIKYMSPEQLRDFPLDGRTDIWSLGVVLYEMLARATPFEATASADTIKMILDSEPVSLMLPSDLPAKFKQIIGKTLEKDKLLRYQTITKLAADMRTLVRELEH
jgi:serine/threonine protein kinase